MEGFDNNGMASGAIFGRLEDDRIPSEKRYYNGPECERDWRIPRSDAKSFGRVGTYKGNSEMNPLLT